MGLTGLCPLPLFVSSAALLESGDAAFHLLQIWIRLDVLVAVAELGSQLGLVDFDLTSDSDGSEDEINEMMMEIGCMSALQTSGTVDIALPRESTDDGHRSCIFFVEPLGIPQNGNLS